MKSLAESVALSVSSGECLQEVGLGWDVLKSDSVSIFFFAFSGCQATLLLVNN
ncbi:conserved hypothetical protein [Ricinus communis]|uniref:Uncharacterized protein n=1 Tax=Ricinus communis TaxID=3988 RepID=B9SYJ8_RICCO|nr:conserved hypothetical protein [Ricinus communis]